MHVSREKMRRYRDRHERVTAGVVACGLRINNALACEGGISIHKVFYLPSIIARTASSEVNRGLNPRTFLILDASIDRGYRM